MRVLEINRNAEVRAGLDLCWRAHQLHRAGNYADAEEALSAFWGGVGTIPDTGELPAELAAEVLLRAGSLTGVLGSTRGLPEAQKIARGILAQSRSLFDALGNRAKAGEALGESGYCFYRTGAYDEARACLREALDLIDPSHADARALTIIRIANVESSAGNLQAAISALTRNYLLFQRAESDSLKAGFHSTLAMAYCHALRHGHPPEAARRAVAECAEALEYYTALNHEPYIVLVRNNMAFASAYLGRIAEAHLNLDEAQSLALAARKEDWLAQIEETRARVLIKEERFVDAEAAIKRSIFLLLRIDQKGLLAESLTTYAVILSRTGRVDMARRKLKEAVEAANSVSDSAGVRLAEYELSKIENLAGLADARSRTFAWRMPADCSMHKAGLLASRCYQFRRGVPWHDGDIVAAVTPAGRFIAFIHDVPPDCLRLSWSDRRRKPKTFMRESVTVEGVVCLA